MNRFESAKSWIASLAGRDVTFRFVEPADAGFILSLRLDERLNAYVSKVDSDIEKQESWIRGYKEREASGSEFYFIILHRGEPVGTVRVYDYRDDSFCWGSWMIRPGTSPKAAIGSMDLVYELAFGHLGFTGSHFDVRQANTRVWSFHEKTGAKLVSENELDRFYRLRSEDYRSPLKR